MTLKEYAAQNKQDTQEVEQENTLDAVARQLQAAEAEKKMLSLSEHTTFSARSWYLRSTSRCFS